MIANHIHDALNQVKKMQELILEKKHFRGYSGKARIMSGIAAILASTVLSSRNVPQDNITHLTGWGIVLLIGLILNYGSVACWFMFDKDVRRNPIMLKPALDAIPALTVGAVLTVTMLLYDMFNLLPGVWMCLYGLAQAAYRLSLPRGIYMVGLIYILCGAYCLLHQFDFTNPWPMGLVFFSGEIIGGFILIKTNHNTDRSNDDKSQ